MDNFKCGCGRDGRYVLLSSEGIESYSCNKYSRCLSYEQLYTLADKRKDIILELLEACSDLHNYQEGRKHYDNAVEVYQRIEKLRSDFKI